MHIIVILIIITTEFATDVSRCTGHRTGVWATQTATDVVHLGGEGVEGIKVLHYTCYSQEYCKH